VQVIKVFLPARLVGLCALLPIMMAMILLPLGGVFAQEAIQGQPARVPGRSAEITLPVKLFCSLKSYVRMPFHGVIRSLPVQVGQEVKAGDTLASYALTSESIVNLRQQLFPPDVRELEIRLAEVERALVEAETSREHLDLQSRRDSTLRSARLQLDRQVQTLARQQKVIQERLWLEKTLSQDRLTVLGKQLGKPLTPGQPLDEALLLAPINGHVVWLNAELREGSEVQPNTLVFQVAQLNPMVARTEVFEVEALQLTLGENAEIELESVPGKIFAATLNRLSWVPVDFRPNQPSYYEAEMVVPNPGVVLREGLAGRATFRH
jgi:multidrug efflux pump subunit AcrA (membrane-fusion protein)